MIDFMKGSFCWTVSSANTQIPHRPLNKKPKPKYYGLQERKGPKTQGALNSMIDILPFWHIGYCHSTHLTTLKWNSLFNLNYGFFFFSFSLLCLDLKDEIRVPQLTINPIVSENVMVGYHIVLQIL